MRASACQQQHGTVCTRFCPELPHKRISSTPCSRSSILQDLAKLDWLRDLVPCYMYPSAQPPVFPQPFLRPYTSNASLPPVRSALTLSVNHIQPDSMPADIQQQLNQTIKDTDSSHSTFAITSFSRPSQLGSLSRAAQLGFNDCQLTSRSHGRRCDATACRPARDLFTYCSILSRGED
ncbi:hypothetical protein BDZ85DRAFT_62091 [Elsinoe ampelina]|uniref:Uncharacterized protein n=1 Tax=Elsinoe ampelina TaxID=302913 RepID=A0A6A6G0J0_9PEZI|nr:hypothetical protein BDZ85DRAFT_62091 [Elsinoe ampelina]